jgi:hypothetical protein
MNTDRFWADNGNVESYVWSQYERDRTDAVFAQFVVQSGLGIRIIDALRQHGRSLYLETINFYTSDIGDLMVAANEQPAGEANANSPRYAYTFAMHKSDGQYFLRGLEARIPLEQTEAASLRREIERSAQRVLEA